MFLYEKKIVYLSHYAQGTRTASAGFVRALGEHGGCMLDIHIKGGGQMPDGDYPLFLLLRTRKIPWGTVAAKDGSVRTGRRISLKQKRAFVEGESFPEEDLCGVLVLLDYGQQIAGYWKQPDASVLSWENQEEKKGREAPAETEIHVAAREVPAAGEKPERRRPKAPKQTGQTLFTGKKYPKCRKFPRIIPWRINGSSFKGAIKGCIPLGMRGSLYPLSQRILLFCIPPARSL